MKTPLGIRLAIWTWFFAALAVGRFAIWQQAPLLALPAALFALTALLVFAYRFFPVFRVWVDGAELRTLVLLHVTRFVGFYFLVLEEHGELPRQLALPGGIGGCLMALLAAIVALAPLSEAFRLRSIYIWNVAGVVDLLLVIISATRVGLANPTDLAPLTHLPLSLLPSFLFPLILASHVAIFARLARLPLHDS